MQDRGSILYDYQINRPAGRRNIRRQRSYTLHQAITPKTCGLLPGTPCPADRDFSEVKAARGFFIVAGLLFVGIGLCSVLF